MGYTKTGKVREPFPKGCFIVDIVRGRGARSKWIYATLRGPDGELLISATLDYINTQLLLAGISEK